MGAPSIRETRTRRALSATPSATAGISAKTIIQWPSRIVWMDSHRADALNHSPQPRYPIRAHQTPAYSGDKVSCFFEVPRSGLEVEQTQSRGHRRPQNGQRTAKVPNARGQGAEPQTKEHKPE